MPSWSSTSPNASIHDTSWIRAALPLVSSPPLPSPTTSVLLYDHLGGRLSVEVSCLCIYRLGEGEQVLYLLAVFQLTDFETVILCIESQDMVSLLE